MIVRGISICLVLVVLSNSGHALKCYQCKTAVGDCIDGQCLGAWCAAIVTEDKTTNTRTVEKTCSQANPSGSGVDGCIKEVNGQTTVQKCGCQIEEFCNSEAGLTRLMNDKNGGAPSGVNLPNGTGPVQPGAPIAPFAAGPNPPFVPGNPNNPPRPGGGPQPLPGQGSQPPLPGQGPQELPPPQVDPNNPNNTNPALPRFPPPNVNQPNPNFPPPQNPNANPNLNGGVQTNPNIIGTGGNINGGQQPPLGNGNTLIPVAEPEPTGTRNVSWSTTSQSPNAINGQPSPNLSDVNKRPASRGSKYSCMCSGPTYCENGKCKGDYCAFIVFSMSDIPRGPGSAPVSSTGPVTHLGCAGQSEVASGNSQRMFPVPQYEVSTGNYVKADERVCTGDFCNSSAVKKISALFLMALATSLLLVR